MWVDEATRELLGEGTPYPWEALTPRNNYSTQLEASRVIKTGAGLLYGITVTNTKASAQFLLAFDMRTVPADGAVPIFAVSVPASDAISLAWLPARAFDTGIVVCNSSTQTSKTIGSADCLFDAQYL